MLGVGMLTVGELERHRLDRRLHRQIIETLRRVDDPMQRTGQCRPCHQSLLGERLTSFDNHIG